DCDPDVAVLCGGGEYRVAGPAAASDSNLQVGPSSVGTFDSDQGGSVTLAADGSFSYDPPSGFTGQDSFTYTATDGTLDSSPATVDIETDCGASGGGDAAHGRSAASSPV